jgi:hypothetical protein
MRSRVASSSAPCNWPRATVVRQNPFARLGVSRRPGRRREQPPSEEQVWKLIRCARELASLAGWYMMNVLELPSEDVAIALGHTDAASSFASSTGTVTTSARSIA